VLEPETTQSVEGGVKVPSAARRPPDVGIAPSVGVSGRRLLEPAKAARPFETHLAKPWRTYQ